MAFLRQRTASGRRSRAGLASPENISDRSNLPPLNHGFYRAKNQSLGSIQYPCYRGYRLFRQGVRQNRAGTFS